MHKASASSMLTICLLIFAFVFPPEVIGASLR